ncbi:hypothetical protein TYRP_006315 [Tyrophagus putrescentiae]|nr:hypothetical protein TYRP_006315 [Tyrophagus putrescentiae]
MLFLLDPWSPLLLIIIITSFCAPTQFQTQTTTTTTTFPPLFNSAQPPTCADLMPKMRLLTTTNGTAAAAIAQSKHVVKSLSLYGANQVVMVYGEESETTSAFVYHYQLPESFNRSRPLSALGLDTPQAVRIIAHDSLANLFPGVGETVERHEIVSLLYIAEQTAVLFFRAVQEGKALFILYQGRSVVQRGHVQTVSGRAASHAVWLAHFGDPEEASTLPKETAIPAHFITLDDQSLQQGTAKLTSPSSSSSSAVPDEEEEEFLQLSLLVNQSRLMGTVANRHDTLYLLLNRSESARYAEFAPFSSVLSLQNWRALLFADYVYVLSGGGGRTSLSTGDSTISKAGDHDHHYYVYYFKPANLTEYYVRATLEQRVGRMRYGTFFGCRLEGEEGGEAEAEVAEEPAFPPEFVFVHIDVLVHTRFFIYLLTLLTFLTALCLICHCGYTPAQERMFRLCRPESPITRTRTRTERSRTAAAENSSESIPANTSSTTSTSSTKSNEEIPLKVVESSSQLASSVSSSFR